MNIPSTWWFPRRWHEPIRDFVDHLEREFERRGDILYARGLPFRVVCLRDPDLVEELFRHPDVAGIKNPKRLSRLAWAMPRSGVVLKGGQEWRDRRRQLQAGFKSDALARYVEMVPRIASAMCDRWQTLVDRSEGVDLQEEMQQLVTQLAFEMYFSKQLSPADLKRIGHLAHFVEFHFVRLTPLWIPTSTNRRFRKYVRELQAVFAAIVAERRASGAQQDDLLSLMLNFTEDDKPWPDHEIVAELMNVFFATSLLSTSFCWTFHRIATEPGVQNQLREEARQAYGDRLPTADDLERMPFSERVLKEVIRLYPSSWVLPRYCERGMSLGEYQIPANTMLFPMVYLSHRHPEYWTAPEKFEPDRFLPERAEPFHASAYYPFGKGERACLGKHLAPKLMRLVIATVLQRYDLQFLSEPPVADFGFEIHPRTEMRFKLLGNPSASIPESAVQRKSVLF